VSTCDHICRECGQVIDCQHCRPHRLPVDRQRIADLEAALRPFAELPVRASIDGTTTTVRVSIADVRRAAKLLQ
jgi:hypothetical protein